MFKKKEKKVKEESESKSKGEALGVAGFTLGILSIIFLGGYVGLIFSLVGFIFCFIQQKKRKTKLGKIGIIINLIGFFAGIIVMIFVTPLLVKYIQSFPTA
jgi:asparagine N-glycosylation enzyme membrane subunit Stt3